MAPSETSTNKKIVGNLTMRKNTIQMKAGPELAGQQAELREAAWGCRKSIDSAGRQPCFTLVASLCEPPFPPLICVMGIIPILQDCCGDWCM